MIEMIFFVAIGLALLALLYFLALRSDPRAEGGAEALLEAHHAVASLRTGLLTAEVVERIFAQDDLDFVMSNAGKPAQELFCRERKKIALSWVTQVRRQVLSLKEFHSGQSRLYAGLNLRTEIGLALTFFSLLVLCRALQVVFYLRGPNSAPFIVQPAISAAGKVCAVSERSLEFLTPRERGAFRNSPGREPAV